MYVSVSPINYTSESLEFSYILLAIGQELRKFNSLSVKDTVIIWLPESLEILEIEDVQASQ